MNLSTFLISSLIAAVFLGIVISGVRRRKNGAGGCAGSSCCGCSGSGICNGASREGDA